MKQGPRYAKNVPVGVQREHVLQALKLLDFGETSNVAESTHYDLHFEGRTYAPKEVLGVAGKILTGEEYGAYDFKGGADSKCFRLLRDLGFKIAAKDDQQCCIYNVEESWVDLLIKYPRELVDYYRKDSRRFNFDLYGIVYFRTKKAGQIVARAKYRGQKVCSFDDACLRFCSLDPSLDEDSFISSLPLNLQGKRSGDIDCLIFGSFEILKQYDRFVTYEEEYGSKSAMSKFVDLLKLQRVADKFDSSSLLDVKPVSETEFSESFESFTKKEGEPKLRYTTFYERLPENRRKCLLKHGYTCKCCGEDFEKKYGSWGKGFIHVHHEVPVSEYGEARIVNPETEMKPVCPNCHAMIHRRKNYTLSIDEVKKLLRGEELKT